MFDKRFDKADIDITSCAQQLCSTGMCPIRGPRGARGPIGPTGPMGPALSIFPFSTAKSGPYLGYDNLGEPNQIAFIGFGTGFPNSMSLGPGDWAAGIINQTQVYELGPAFVMPRDGILRNIHVLFAARPYLYAGETVRPFVAIATSDASNLIYTVLKDTITYTAPYTGDLVYNDYAVRRGSLTDLNIALPADLLVGIIAGITAEGSISLYGNSFNAMVSGGLYIE